MLRIEPTASSDHPRIHIDGVLVKAWIEHQAWRHGSTDWTLWYERDGRLARGKCQLQLEIESRLRAWLLRRRHAPLATLSFDELRLIADGKAGEARRIHARGIDGLMHRLETPAIPRLSN